LTHDDMTNIGTQSVPGGGSKAAQVFRFDVSVAWRTSAGARYVSDWCALSSERRSEPIWQ